MEIFDKCANPDCENQAEIFTGIKPRTPEKKKEKDKINQTLISNPLILCPACSEGRKKIVEQDMKREFVFMSKEEYQRLAYVPMQETVRFTNKLG